MINDCYCLRLLVWNCVCFAEWSLYFLICIEICLLIRWNIDMRIAYNIKLLLKLKKTNLIYVHDDQYQINYLISNVNTQYNIRTVHSYHINLLWNIKFLVWILSVNYDIMKDMNMFNPNNPSSLWHTQ